MSSLERGQMNSSETSRMACSSCFCLRLRSVSVVLTEELETDSSDEGGGVRFSRVEDDDLGEVMPEPGFPGDRGGSGPFFFRPTDRRDRSVEFDLVDLSPPFALENTMLEGGGSGSMDRYLLSCAAAEGKD